MTWYVLAVMFVATLCRSTFGFGEALVGVPLLVLLVPFRVSAPLAVILSVVVSAVILVQDWEQVRLRSAGGLLLATLPGIPLGIYLLIAGGEHIGRLLVGIILVVFSSYSLWRRKHNVMGPPRAQHWMWLAVSGFLAGVLGGAYGMNGPPLAIYGSMRRWLPQDFGATLQGYFMPASLVGLVGYWAAGLWTPAVTRYALVSLPGVTVAIFLGRWFNRRLHPASFQVYVHGILLMIGIAQLVQVVWR